MISAAELSKMRTQANRTRDTTCTIQTFTDVADGMGGFSQTWANTAANVPCRLTAQTIQAQTGQTANRYQVRGGWIVHVAHDQALSQGQRVVVGSDTYEVLNVEDASSERASRRAHLRRIEP